MMFKVVVSRPLVRELRLEGLVDMIEAGGVAAGRANGTGVIRQKKRTTLGGGSRKLQNVP